MAERDLMPIRPLREAHIGSPIVRFSDNRVDKLIACVGCFPLRLKRVAPIPMSSFPIWIDGDCLREPGASSIESVTAKLRVSRLVAFLELHIAGIQRGFVKTWVELKRLPVLRQRLVQIN